jgi:hypothetical protein
MTKAAADVEKRTSELEQECRAKVREMLSVIQEAGTKADKIKHARNMFQYIAEHKDCLFRNRLFKDTVMMKLCYLFYCEAWAEAGNIYYKLYFEK